MTPTRRRVAARGLELSVLVWEPAAARAGDAMLVHGFGDIAASWDEIAPALAAAGLRVVAPDLRGFGASDRVHPSGYYYFPDYVFDLVEVADPLLGDAPFGLVGHSMGGTVAVMLAGLHPARVGRLALLEGLGPPAIDDDDVVDRERAWVEGVRRARRSAPRPMTEDELAERLALTHPSVPEAVIRRRALALATPLGDGRYAWAMDPLHRTSSPIPFSIERWRAHARRVTAPTLCLGGGSTGFHPPDEAERVATIRGARAEEIEGAGHMLHWTRPAEVAERLARHLVG
jgi:pimeloyl-ACP methyl ester carboxylesterase